MTKQKILLIQSAHTQGNGTKRHLEEGGYQVILAGSGLIALTMARNTVIDLILLDVALPDIQGLDLCRTFRQRPDTRSIPIILFTARGYTPDPTISAGFGPDAYLTKPYSENELDEQITAVLKSKPSKQTEIGRESGNNSPQKSEQPAERKSGSESASPMEKKTITENVQQAPKPDLKPVDTAIAKSNGQGELVPSTPTERPLLDQSPAPKSVLTEIPQPASQQEVQPPAAMAEQETSGKTETAQVVGQSLEHVMEPPSIPSHKPAPNEEPTKSTEPDSPHPSPVLSFKGNGDAVVDPSTGLFGRPQFEAMFSKEFKRAMRFKQQLSLMLIDLNGQKREQRADEKLVKEIIRLVQKTIREVDTAAWWSGEAFIVLLPNTIRNDALQAAARVLEAIAAHPFTWPDATRITINIGVAGLPDKNINSEFKMIEAAGVACRRAQELMIPPPFDVRSLKR